MPDARTTKLWNTKTRKHLATLKHRGWVRALAFSPDGERLASAAGRIVKVCHVPALDLQFVLEGHEETVEDVNFSPDGRLLTTASADQTVKLWDAATGKEKRTLDFHLGKMDAVIFAPDGKRLAAAGGPDIVVWDVKSRH